jgi:hypothetical protein
MKLPSAGYSGKSLPDKLGYKPATVVAFLALPEALAGLAASAPFAKVTRAKDWAKSLPAGSFDLIHAFTDVTEDIIRAAALKLDLVDVKVAAVDAVWSGLKLVIRKERRRHDAAPRTVE